MSRYTTCSTCGQRMLRMKQLGFFGRIYLQLSILFKRRIHGISGTCIACGNPAYPDCVLGCDILEDD